MLVKAVDLGWTLEDFYHPSRNNGMVTGWRSPSGLYVQCEALCLVLSVPDDTVLPAGVQPYSEGGPKSTRTEN